MSTATLATNTATFASEAAGATTMADPVRWAVSYNVAEYTDRLSGTYGRGVLGSAVSAKSYAYTPVTRSATGAGGFANITLTTTSGAILGKIRTDIERSIVESLSFTLDERGCAEFELTLNALPDFPLTPISIIAVNIGNTSFNWYTGYLEEAPDVGTPRTEYKYRGFGLRKALDRIKAEVTYTAPQDVGSIVDDLVQTYVQPETPIGYNAGKIDTSTGVLIASDNELSTAKLTDVFDMYAKMAGARWGVDGDGEFYFEVKTPSTIQRTWFIGYEFESFEPDLNTQDIKNSIFVTRQTSKGSGGTGWAVAAIANDLTSQAKYGLQELQYQMKGFFSDDDCELVAASLLDELAEPKYYGTVKNIPVTSSDQYLERGVHRFIGDFDTFSTVAEQFDGLTGITEVVATGDDLVVSLNTDTFVSGAASVDLDWTNATGSRIEGSISFKGVAKKVRLWIRGTRAGQLITLGIGTSVWNTYTKTVAVDVTGQWFLWEWDVSALSITELDTFGIEIDDSDGTATTVSVDSLTIVGVGSPYYKLELTTAKYKFEPGKQVVEKAEFGPPPKKMYDYVAQLQAQAEENRFVGEVR